MRKSESSFDVTMLGVAVVDIIAYPADRSLFDHDNTPVDEVMLLPGGDAVNQSVFLAGLGSSVSLSCRLGNDSMGRFLLGEVSSAGVDTSGVRLADASSTSTAVVLVSKTGDRNIICKRGNNYDFCIDDVDMDAIASSRALSVGSYYGMPKLEENGLEDVLAHAKKHDAAIFADMGSDKKNLRLKGIERFLAYTDFFMPSEAESTHLTDEASPERASALFRECGAGGVIIKLGARGAYADIPGFAGYVNPFDISAVDTTGCGDAFCAGFIHSVLSGKSPEQSLEFASACGAFAAQSFGARHFGISHEAILSFISNTPGADIY